MFGARTIPSVTSNLKGCQILAGGKAQGRHPPECVRKQVRPWRGRRICRQLHFWHPARVRRCLPRLPVVSVSLRPPANIWHPSGMPAGRRGHRPALRTIPKGLGPPAQGWRATPTLGARSEIESTPTALWLRSGAPSGTDGPQPRCGWGCLSADDPRVARASQPWALGRNIDANQSGKFELFQAQTRYC